MNRAWQPASTASKLRPAGVSNGIGVSSQLLNYEAAIAVRTGARYYG